MMSGRATKVSRSGRVSKKKSVLNFGACKICGAPSTGIHYAAISCEGCKAFFKRSLDAGAGPKFKCYFGGECDTSMYSHSCKACRFKKCLEAGMDLSQVKLGRISDARKKQLMETENVTRDCASLSPAASATDSSNSSGNSVSSITSAAISNSSPLSAVVLLHDPILDHRPDVSQFLLEPFSPYNTGKFLNPVCSLDELPRIMSLDNMFVPVSFMRDLNYTCPETVKAVEHALDVAYGEQLRKWDNFMHRAIHYGEVPKQPQAPLEMMVAVIAHDINKSMNQAAQFAALLPGFEKFDRRDQEALKIDRWMEFQLVACCNYMLNGECYTLVGPEDYHRCVYWISQISRAEYIETCIPFVATLHSIGLTKSETFVLMAAAFFRPAAPGLVKNNLLLNFLHVHYIDVLLHLMMARTGRTRNEMLSKLQGIMHRFNSFWTLNRLYVDTSEFTELPSEKVGAAAFFAVLKVDLNNNPYPPASIEEVPPIVQETDR